MLDMIHLQLQVMQLWDPTPRRYLGIRRLGLRNPKNRRWTAKVCGSRMNRRDCQTEAFGWSIFPANVTLPDCRTSRDRKQ